MLPWIDYQPTLKIWHEVFTTSTPFAWNEALFALTLTGNNSQTLPVFILASRSTRGVRFGFAAVNTLLAIGPPVLFSLFIQRYLAKGLTFGAVKG